MEMKDVEQCINKLDAITIDIEKMQYIAMQIFDRSAHKPAQNERLSKYQMHELNKCSSILLDYLQNMLEGTREIITVLCKLEESNDTTQETM